MIRRDFMKLLSIASASLAVPKLLRPKAVLAQAHDQPRRQWLSGSTRTGCAHYPINDIPIH